mgnify:CR=1 FL=1
MKLDKSQALTLLKTHIQNENLRRHCLSVGIVMKALAEKLGGDPQEWEILGIIHDSDWEETKDNPDQHTVVTLGRIDDPRFTHALQSHNTHHTHLAELEGNMEWALECCDELTGFIVAVALVRPEKKLETVTVESVLKKWKTKEFAKAVNRTQIAQCEEKLKIPLTEFIQITLAAMQNHHEELGL